jgi:hypothetical protein
VSLVSLVALLLPILDLCDKLFSYRARIGQNFALSKERETTSSNRRANMAVLVNRSTPVLIGLMKITL